MSWQFKQYTYGQASSGTTVSATYPAAVEAGDTLLAWVNNGASATGWASVSDTLNGLWTLLGSLPDSGASQEVELWAYTPTVAGTPTVTATIESGTINYAILNLVEYSGLNTKVLNLVDQSTGDIGTGTAISSGATGVLEMIGELCEGFIMLENGGETITLPAGWTDRSGGHASPADYDATSTAAVTFTATLSASDSWGAALATLKLPVAAVASVDDTFSRADQSGWGDNAAGNAWQQLQQYGSSTLSIASDKGVMASSSGSADTYMVLAPDLTDADTTTLVRFILSTTGSANSDTAGVLARAQDGNNYYMAYYNANTGTQELIVSKRVAGVKTNLGTYSITSVAAGTAYWLRLQVVGDTVEARLWEDGTTEPSAWQVSATDSAISAAGVAGVVGWAVSSTGIEFDQFSAQAPATPASGAGAWGGPIPTLGAHWG